jgi:transposase InsO family protein
MALQKDADIAASIPEIIRRARQLGIIDQDAHIDRTTAFRTARKMGLPTRRRRGARQRDSRPYAFAHRMDCILVDGKHFRAGPSHLKRVAFFFLDDASRYCLHVVVGTSENEALLLRGLYEMIRKYGFMVILYMDWGPGFKGLDTIDVVAKFPGRVLIIHGEARYPEGHGKIERFNQTAKQQCLRLYDGRPDVDPDCRALELRLGHYVSEQYNRTVHEALNGQTPWQCFHDDAQPLRLPESDADLRSRFVVHFKRTLSNDHVVKIHKVPYEMPLHYPDSEVIIHHRLLDDTYAVVHDGKLVDIHPADLVQNARTPRAGVFNPPQDDDVKPFVRSAADLAFANDFRPAVDPDGSCPES